MKNHHQIFALPKTIFWLLALANVIYAIWLDAQFDSFWGWNFSDLAGKESTELKDFVALGQFLLFAVTLDMAIRHFVVRFNKQNPSEQVPAILVQAVTIFFYGLIGLFAFIIMYDHSAGQLLAASGAIGFGLAYVLREMIADVVACIQIQSEGLIGIGDFIDVKGEEYYQVVQIDRRMVTLKTVAFQYIVRVPNRRFINLNIVNITKQEPAVGSRRSLEIDVDSGNDVDKLIDLINQALKYIIKTDSNFHSWYRVYLPKINNGSYFFAIKYECNPALTVHNSGNTLNLAIIRFFKLGGINMNSTMETTASSEIVDSINGRLIKVYRRGVLKALSPNEVTRLSDASQVVTCRAGQMLIEKGHSADSMYFLVEGGLEVSIHDDQGKEVVVATIWPGDCVGEMSLLTGAPRSANVRAMTNSILLEITKADIAPIFEENPELIYEISSLLEARQAENMALLNKSETSEESEKKIKALAKKIFSFFFGKT